MWVRATEKATQVGGRLVNRRSIIVLGYIALAWALLVAIPTSRVAREVLIAPLLVHDPTASGECVYVLAGGHAMHERLRAAADLYHWKRAPQILLFDDGSGGGFRFTAGQSWSAARWALEYLVWLGVAREDVFLIAGAPDGGLGTRAEARILARALPGATRKIVLVTSAPHTRRTLLAFRRVLPSDVSATIYAATSVRDSAELYEPIWLEYGKLLLYALLPT